MNSNYSLKVNYAVTGRAQCRGCWTKIEKDCLRVAYVINVDNYHNEKWFHLDCFRYLPTKVMNVQIEHITGYDILSPNDKQLLDMKIYELKNMPREKQILEAKKEAQKRKMMKTGVMKDDFFQRQYQRKEKQRQQLRQDDAAIMNNDDEYQQFQQQNQKKISQKHRDYYYDVSENEELDQSYHQNFDDQMPKYNQITQEQMMQMMQRNNKNQSKPGFSYLKQPNQLPQQSLRELQNKYFQQEEEPPEPKPMGYTEQEWETFQKNMEEFSKKTALVLKEILRYNDQLQTGNKHEILERVADMVTLGAIPRCPECKHGKLKYDKNEAQYECPGFVKRSGEFTKCDKIFYKENIKRKRCDLF